MGVLDKYFCCCCCLRPYILIFNSLTSRQKEINSWECCDVITQSFKVQHSMQFISPALNARVRLSRWSAVAGTLLSCEQKPFYRHCQLSPAVWDPRAGTATGPAVGFQETSTFLSSEVPLVALSFRGYLPCFGNVSLALFLFF